MPTPLTQRIFNKIKSATGWKLSEPQEAEQSSETLETEKSEQSSEISKTSETKKPEPAYCLQAVSQLKAYKKQHQNLKQQFSDLMSQNSFLPDIKWDEPFMSSPYYKDITNAPKEIFDNLYDAKEEARKKLEELKELSGHNEKQEKKEFSKLTQKQKINHLRSRCFKPTQDPNQEPQYQQPIPDLKRHELEFLYDNYQDEKLTAIITQRDKNADMLRIFDCTPNQIVHNQQELQQAIKDKKEIKAYLGKLFPNFFKVIPQNVEYIYTQFPESRIKKMEVTIGGQSKEELIEEVKAKFIVPSSAESILKSPDFTVSKQKENLTLIHLKVQDLGFPIGAMVKEIFAKAEKLGLELCPAETGPQLRKQYLDQPLDEWFLIGMKPITDSVGNPDVFNLDRNEDGLWLRSYWTDPDGWWCSDFEFVFRFRKLET